MLAKHKVQTSNISGFYYWCTQKKQLWCLNLSVACASVFHAARCKTCSSTVWRHLMHFSSTSLWCRVCKAYMCTALSSWVHTPRAVCAYTCRPAPFCILYTSMGMLFDGNHDTQSNLEHRFIVDLSLVWVQWTTSMPRASTQEEASRSHHNSREHSYTPELTVHYLTSWLSDSKAGMRCVSLIREMFLQRC